MRMKKKMNKKICKIKSERWESEGKTIRTQKAALGNILNCRLS